MNIEDKSKMNVAAAAVLCILVLSLEQNFAAYIIPHNAFDRYELECIKELQLDMRKIWEISDIIHIGKDSQHGYNNFVGCYWQKRGWQKSDGEIDFEAVRKNLAEELNEALFYAGDSMKLMVLQLLNDSISECKNNPPEKGAALHETAHKVQNCIMLRLKSA